LLKSRLRYYSEEKMKGRIIAGLAAVGLAGAWGGVELYQNGRIQPGVVADGVAVGGLTLAEASAKIKAEGLATNPPKVEVVTLGQRQQLSAAALGWRPDPAKTAEAAYRIGRSHDYFTDLGVRFAVWREGQAVPLVASVDVARLKAQLTGLALPYKRAAQNAKIVYSANPKPQYALRNEVPGRALDVATAVWQYQNDPHLTALTIPELVLPATVLAKQLAPAVAQANSLLRPLKLVYQVEASPKVSASNKASTQATSIATTSSTSSQPATPTISKSLTLSASQVADLFFVKADGLSPDSKTIAATVASLGNRFDREARNARYVLERGGLGVQPEQIGFALKRQDAIAKLTEAVLDPASADVALVAAANPPKIIAASLPDPKTFVLLSSATTSYGGSPRARLINVSAASRHLDGYIVGVGEEFNFNQAIGDISLANGYATALVIANGRTTDGVGGGVCQVSTTAFRALYKAGLPIIERNPHAYRVHWYDPIIGFDAAVYQPSVNMRMQNDTGGPILVRSATRGASLTVQLYGPPNNRQVTISRPRILARMPAPPTLTQYVSYLPAGARKQVDWSADGYRITLGRTVREAGTSRSDTLFTYYKPWRAIIHVGRSTAKAKSGLLASR
jgi:vancomycin resistance protein YoaR